MPVQNLTSSRRFACLSQGIFTCRLYQMDFTVSALTTDSRSFIFFFYNLSLISTWTPTFSSRQSEVATVVVFSYQPRTRHLPPLVLPLILNSRPWLTSLPLVISYSHARKDDTNKTSSSHLCSDRNKKETNVKRLFVHPVVRLQKGSLQNVSSTRFHLSRNPRALFTTLLLGSETSLQKTNSLQLEWSPGEIINLREDQMCNLTSRTSNLTRRLH